MADAQRCLNCGREMPARAPQDLCQACLVAGILDSQPDDEEPTSSLDISGEPAATADGGSTGTDRTGNPFFGARADPSMDSALTVECGVRDGPPGDEGSVDPGTHIRYFGDYEIRGVLGSGAMGFVYEARQISLSRTVALKMMRAGALANDEELKRFQNEAESVARLDHPHIVPIYEVGEHDGKRYFTMKLIGGPCLSRTLAAYTADTHAAARLMVTIAEAVHHAHQRGILHRDLKPSNILLDELGQPHVSDFGLAKQVADDDSLTESGAVLGTPAYMAPEQAAGRKRLVTTLSDVYGLGAVLYALLTSKPPFGGDSVMETLEQVRHQQPFPPSRVNPKVPRDLEIICLKCLEKDPQRRYPSAQALGAELRRFLDGEPIQARPVGALEKGWRWCRRRPVIAGLTAALGVAVLGGLIGTSLGLVAALDARANALNRERDARNAQAAEFVARGDAERESERAKAQTERAEQVLYDNRMNLVQQYWDNNHRQLIDPALDELLPENQGGKDRRGFEWFYWRRQFNSKPVTISAHHGDVMTAVFSPDGTRLASASSDRTVKVWDTATWRRMLILRGHTDTVSSAVFSPDGSRLASAGADGTVKLWEASTGKEIRTLNGHTASVFCVAFSADGKQLASGSIDHTAKLWDAGTGNEIHSLAGHSDTVTSTAFSPDGKQLATASGDGTVKVWNPASAKEMQTLKGHDRALTGVAFRPDGKRLAAAGYGSTVKVWDTASWREILSLKRDKSDPPTGELQSVAFSPDGQQLATGSWDGTAKLWNAETGQELFAFVGHIGGVHGVAFSPDGTRLATASEDRTVKVWDARIGRDPLTLSGHSHVVNSVAFSPDGKWIASGGFDGSVIVWDAATGRETRTASGGVVYYVAFSPDGRRLACTSGDTVAVLDNLGDDDGIRTLKGHDGDVLCVAFNPDSKRLASAGGDGTIKVWDAATGRETLAFKAARNKVYADGTRSGSVFNVKFSPDGTRLASANGDRTATIWDAATGREIFSFKGHDNVVYSVAFSPDGKRLASASRDRTIKVWDAATGQAALTLRGHTDIVVCVAFSPDGRRLASAGYEGTVRVWDAATGQETLTLNGHGGGVLSVAFSPDGQRLASASRDQTVKMWDARPALSEATPGSSSASARRMAVAAFMKAPRLSFLQFHVPESTYNLKQIGVALRDFHSKFNHFPADFRDSEGKPMLSWRVRLLPFLDEQELFDAFRLNEPWDSAHNKTLLEQMPTVFDERQRNDLPAPGMTFYRGFTGKRALFDPAFKEGVGALMFTDGMSNTIAMVEGKVAVPWTKPDCEIPFVDEANPDRMKALFDDVFVDIRGGFSALFCDGSVRFIDANVDLRLLHDLITRDGREVIPTDSESISPPLLPSE